MSSTEMKIVRNDGAVFETGRETGWIIEQDSLDEWTVQDMSVTTSSNVLNDGSSFVSKRVEEKDRTATLFYVGSLQPRQARDTALSFFNPKYSFRVYLTHLGITRWVEGELYAVECRLRPEKFPTKVTFSILCLDPYFRDESPNDKAFRASVPMLGWPFVSHLREEVGGKLQPVGFSASRRIYDGRNTVYNQGDVPTNYTVRIEAEGTLKNPAIVKDGRKVQLMRTMVEGDVAVIDFETSPPKVTYNGANAINLCSRDSAFTKMAMQPGKNTFSFVVENTENRSLAKVQVIHYKKYLGV